MTLPLTHIVASSSAPPWMYAETIGPSRTKVFRNQTCSVGENCPSHQIMQPLIPHGGESLFWAALHPPSAAVSKAKVSFQPTPGTKFFASQVASVSITTRPASAIEPVAENRPINRMRCLARVPGQLLAGCWMPGSMLLLKGPLFLTATPDAGSCQKCTPSGQRTRSSTSRRHSPLTRSPLGGERRLEPELCGRSR